MFNDYDERAVELGRYITENKSTVRAAAKKFGISKSTVHIDVSQRLKKVNPELYNSVRKVLDINKAERHIRGGLATKEKYSMPNNNGPSDIVIATYKIFFALTAIRTLPFMQNINNNTNIKHVIIAVNKGEKFAYPNGTKSK